MSKLKLTLITGGAGFIGSHLCDAYIKKGWGIICLDNLITGRKENIAHLLNHPNFKFLKIDITSSAQLKPLYLSHFTTIYNLACPASPKAYSRYSIETLLTSSIGTQNILELARKMGARFVHTSTSEVYGDPKEHPQKETYWGNVNCYGERSSYDEGKRYSESLIYFYRKKYKLNTGIARVFNTYGPLMKPDDGRVVSNFIAQAIKNQPITIYGDGTQTRSFCYISDMIDGLVKMAESDEEGPINLGNPNQSTIMELARKILTLTNSKSKIVFKKLPPDDPVKRQPDISWARKKLGWQPKVSLDEGLGKTIKWFRDSL